MTKQAPAFSHFEFLIAWRYLKAKKAEGGVSTMTVISLIGISLAVAALIIVLAVRAGFRAEFVDTILGANAHIAVYENAINPETGVFNRTIADYDQLAQDLLQLPAITRAAPQVRGQVMINYRDRAYGVDIYGVRLGDLKTVPRIGIGSNAIGEIDDFSGGIALGSGLARNLGVGLGDTVKLISPNGVRTAFGTSPRVKSFLVVYIFTAGRYDIDGTRAYLPFEQAQSFFNRDGVVDEVELYVAKPDAVDQTLSDVLPVIGLNRFAQTWQDRAGAFLRALEIEDNVMMVIMGVLVLLSTMNIVSGLIMLVTNKGRDIGILRTMGLTEGSILRVFFICGSGIGVIGTALGVAMGIVFVLNIDAIFALVNQLSGGNAWDPAIRGIYRLPAELRVIDVGKAVAISLGLSFAITYFPARRAARMNPVEALRYE